MDEYFEEYASSLCLEAELNGKEDDGRGAEKEKRMSNEPVFLYPCFHHSRSLSFRLDQPNRANVAIYSGAPVEDALVQTRSR